MANAKKKSKNEIIQDLAEEWRAQTGKSPIDAGDFAAWLIREKGWQPEPVTAFKVIRKEVQRALREQYIDDPQGRRVRRKHPQRIAVEMKDGSQEQHVLWHDIREASRPEMQAAFQQRRFGVVLDCHRLKTDVDSYNENWNTSTVSIQMEFDFTDDMADLDYDEHGADYEDDC